MGTDPLTAARIAELAYDPTGVSIGDIAFQSFEVIATRPETASGFKGVGLVSRAGFTPPLPRTH